MKVQYSDDGTNFLDVETGKEFETNLEGFSNDKKLIIFASEIEAKYFKIEITEYNSYSSFRVDLLKSYMAFPATILGVLAVVPKVASGRT